MAVAKSNSIIEPSLCMCSCYRVSSLRETILDAHESAGLKDRYVLGEQLGWGQFGIIRKCVDKFSGEVLACKSIAKDRLVTREDARSIKLEIEIMTRLSGHPNVVDLKAVYEEEDYVHLVMELCAGGELFHKLEKHGRFSEPEARVVFRHLMQVVMYCHEKGVIHRDLKPENILLATKASSSPIKLADFGLATYISPGQSLHGRVGSPFYIAPEVLAGGYNQAADVWSAGVILYILLSGIPPFWGKTKSRIFDAVRAADLRFPSDPWDFISDSAKELIKGMLCRDNSRRLTAQQVLDHAWLRDILSLPNDMQEHGRLVLEQGCLSSSLMCRSRDISFGTGSPVISEVQLPSFTCKSSFSSFLAGPSKPSSEIGGFSFRNSAGSNASEFSAPLLALPSFAFFGGCNAVEQASDALDLTGNPSRIDLIPGADDIDSKAIEAKKGGFGVARSSGIRSRRNHTIGPIEFEHIDIITTESVIRWASCTHLPTATSLRSSLVC
ncbi:Ca2+/calmodulin-dependent protein kinase, EF-Hand protein superfamily [Handroanthus impetiginosus]|uniref:non-specific serine/threonine protein kinase n=1 Tax=Handroanthus impetiginosus TaxID=429701 RepID=A0A2G9HGM3_9LAMI|nr:Ca2+/calmodulin-dependent protein kinase, EF-Hand protein superfamily [Handroanthus impetiginosus]